MRFIDIRERNKELGGLLQHMDRLCLTGVADGCDSTAAELAPHSGEWRAGVSVDGDKCAESVGKERWHTESE